MAATPTARATAGTTAGVGGAGARTMRIGSIAGIPLRIHASWLIALFLATASLSVNLTSVAGRAAPAIALVTSLLLFASLIAHELGHALVAQRCGVGVNAITLFVFGGVATLDTEPRRPRDELAIAIAGPLVSVAIGALCFGLGTRSGQMFGDNAALPAIVAEPLTWLGRINLGLAVFNMLPGFPLDGGRVLRGILWAINKDAWRATLAAARVGRGIAWALISLGVARAAFGSIADGLWIGFVGWFLLTAARSAAEQADLRALVGDTPVSEAMLRRFPTVPLTMTIGELVRSDAVLTAGQRIHVVVAPHVGGQQIAGIVTLDRVLGIDRALWERTTLASPNVLINIADLPMLDAHVSMLDALNKVGEAPLAFIRDETSNLIVGILDHDRLAAIIGVRLELGRSARSLSTTTTLTTTLLPPPRGVSGAAMNGEPAYKLG